MGSIMLEAIMWGAVIVAAGMAAPVLIVAVRWVQDWLRLRRYIEMHGRGRP